MKIPTICSKNARKLLTGLVEVVGADCSNIEFDIYVIEKAANIFRVPSITSYAKKFYAKCKDKSKTCDFEYFTPIWTTILKSKKIKPDFNWTESQQEVYNVLVNSYLDSDFNTDELFLLLSIANKHSMDDISKVIRELLVNSSPRSIKYLNAVLESKAQKVENVIKREKINVITSFDEEVHTITESQAEKMLRKWEHDKKELDIEVSMIKEIRCRNS